MACAPYPQIEGNTQPGLPPQLLILFEGGRQQAKEATAIHMISEKKAVTGHCCLILRSLNVKDPADSSRCSKWQPQAGKYLEQGQSCSGLLKENPETLLDHS